MKNHLWNMFANIKNGQLAKNHFVMQNKKKICEEFLKVLWNEGFILGYKHCIIENKRMLKIFLKYSKEQPVITELKTVSRPGRRLYYSIKQIWKINPRAFIIFSTNQGLKTVIECKKLKIGGEPFIVLN